jgi:hypothetical protein
MRLRLTLAIVLLCSPVLAHDNGQFGNVPDNVRAWFKAMKSPQGVPCCDIADGHRTDYDMREDKYWVPINGKWVPVPPDAVLKDTSNPTGDAVVWYTIFNGTAYIRCFVPGGGACAFASAARTLLAASGAERNRRARHGAARA